MTTSEKGKEIIKRYEDLELEAYLCPAGVWTIGYGHTRTAKRGMVITPDKAEKLLTEDVMTCESGLSRALGDKLKDINQNQFDALISFCYNLGMGAFRSSTLLKRINEDVNHSDIPYQFSRWIKANGVTLSGLVKRRKEEAELYVS